MNFSRIITVMLLITTLLLAIACKGRGEAPTEEALDDNDTTRIDSIAADSLQDIVEVVPPEKADELFDDFAFAFMKNRHFQKQRINFPLRYTVCGETKIIGEKEWQHDRMYSQYEVYTLIFDNMKGERAAKDTTLRHVVVEELNLESKLTKSYNFERKNKEWRLTALAEIPMSESSNCDFYEFYHRFATENNFQLEHINAPLAYSTFDDDNFETIEGVIEPEQFKEFSPELPTSKITNILYGQTCRNANLRVMSLRALAGGMECTMVFKKIDGEWMLTRLDN